ncbi:hypothetical protein BX266_5608 [Streptomyces sp. TLI_171]|nr:hypothetical protein BX266_5608 [Streptomyces sp. TLI_171]
MLGAQPVARQSAGPLPAAAPLPRTETADASVSPSADTRTPATAGTRATSAAAVTGTVAGAENAGSGGVPVDAAASATALPSRAATTAASAPVWGSPTPSGPVFQHAGPAGPASTPAGTDPAASGTVPLTGLASTVGDAVPVAGDRNTARGVVAVGSGPDVAGQSQLHLRGAVPAAAAFGAQPTEGVAAYAATTGMQPVGDPVARTVARTALGPRTVTSGIGPGADAERLASFASTSRAVGSGQGTAGRREVQSVGAAGSVLAVLTGRPAAAEAPAPVPTPGEDTLDPAATTAPSPDPTPAVGSASNLEPASEPASDEVLDSELDEMSFAVPEPGELARMAAWTAGWQEGPDAQGRVRVEEDVLDEFDVPELDSDDGSDDGFVTDEEDDGDGFGFASDVDVAALDEDFAADYADVRALWEGLKDVAGDTLAGALYVEAYQVAPRLSAKPSRRVVIGDYEELRARRLQALRAAHDLHRAPKKARSDLAALTGSDTEWVGLLGGVKRPRKRHAGPGESSTTDTTTASVTQSEDAGPSSSRSWSVVARNGPAGDASVQDTTAGTVSGGSAVDAAPPARNTADRSGVVVAGGVSAVLSGGGSSQGNLAGSGVGLGPEGVVPTRGDGRDAGGDVGGVFGGYVDAWLEVGGGVWGPVSPGNGKEKGRAHPVWEERDPERVREHLVSLVGEEEADGLVADAWMLIGPLLSGLRLLAGTDPVTQVVLRRRALLAGVTAYALHADPETTRAVVSARTPRATQHTTAIPAGAPRTPARGPRTPGLSALARRGDRRALLNHPRVSGRGDLADLIEAHPTLVGAATMQSAVWQAVLKAPALARFLTVSGNVTVEQLRVLMKSNSGVSRLIPWIDGLSDGVAGALTVQQVREYFLQLGGTSSERAENVIRPNNAALNSIIVAIDCNSVRVAGVLHDRWPKLARLLDANRGLIGHLTNENVLGAALFRVPALCDWLRTTGADRDIITTGISNLRYGNRLFLAVLADLSTNVAQGLTVDQVELLYQHYRQTTTPHPAGLISSMPDVAGPVAPAAGAAEAGSDADLGVGGVPGFSEVVSSLGVDEDAAVSSSVVSLGGEGRDENYLLREALLAVHGNLFNDLVSDSLLWRAFEANPGLVRVMTRASSDAVERLRNSWVLPVVASSEVVRTVTDASLEEYLSVFGVLNGSLGSGVGSASSSRGSGSGPVGGARARRGGGSEDGGSAGSSAGVPPGSERRPQGVPVARATEGVAADAAATGMQAVGHSVAQIAGWTAPGPRPVTSGPDAEVDVERLAAPASASRTADSGRETAGPRDVQSSTAASSVLAALTGRSAAAGAPVPVPTTVGDTATTLPTPAPAVEWAVESAQTLESASESVPGKVPGEVPFAVPGREEPTGTAAWQAGPDAREWARLDEDVLDEDDVPEGGGPSGSRSGVAARSGPVGETGVRDGAAGAVSTDSVMNPALPVRDTADRSSPAVAEQVFAVLSGSDTSRHNPEGSSNAARPEAVVGTRGTEADRDTGGVFGEYLDAWLRARHGAEDPASPGTEKGKGRAHPVWDEAEPEAVWEHLVSLVGQEEAGGLMAGGWTLIRPFLSGARLLVGTDTASVDERRWRGLLAAVTAYSLHVDRDATRAELGARVPLTPWDNPGLPAGALRTAAATGSRITDSLSQDVASTARSLLGSAPETGVPHGLAAPSGAVTTAVSAAAAPDGDGAQSTRVGAAAVAAGEESSGHGPQPSSMTITNVIAALSGEPSESGTTILGPHAGEGEPDSMADDGSAGTAISSTLLGRVARRKNISPLLLSNTSIEAGTRKRVELGLPKSEAEELTDRLAALLDAELLDEAGLQVWITDLCRLNPHAAEQFDETFEFRHRYAPVEAVIEAAGRGLLAEHLALELLGALHEAWQPPRVTDWLSAVALDGRPDPSPTPQIVALVAAVHEDLTRVGAGGSAKALRRIGALDRDLRALWALQRVWRQAYGTQLREELVSAFPGAEDQIAHLLAETTLDAVPAEVVDEWHQNLSRAHVLHPHQGPISLAYDYPDDGCQYRAHEATLLLHRWGAAVSKVVVVRRAGLSVTTENADGATPTRPGKVTWGWHIAPAVHRIKPDSTRQLVVLDPALSTEALPLDAWATAAGGSEKHANIYRGTLEQVREQILDDQERSFAEHTAVAVLPATVGSFEVGREAATLEDLDEQFRRWQITEILAAYSQQAADRRLARELDSFLRNPQHHGLAPEERSAALEQWLNGRSLHVATLRRYSRTAAALKEFTAPRTRLNALAVRALDRSDEAGWEDSDAELDTWESVAEIALHRGPVPGAGGEDFESLLSDHHQGGVRAFVDSDDEFEGEYDEGEDPSDLAAVPWGV